MPVNLRFVASLLAIVLITTPAIADDIANASDHPLVTRYPGTEITDYELFEFRDFQIATGPLSPSDERTALPPVNRGEGKVTSITYLANDEVVSALQIFRNFEKAFNDSGFRKEFSCDSEAQCGENFVVQLYWYGDNSRQGRHGRLNAPNRRGNSERYFYWAGEATTAAGNFVISLLVAQDSAQAFPAVVVLDVNQPESIELGKVTVNLEGLANDIDKTGRAVLAGILFDHDSATLEQESAAALQVIAGYLAAHAEQSFFVVGHTDNTGNFEYNQSLSKSRAEAVVAALADNYGIAIERLRAIGVGPVSPATTNMDEDGRTSNRRVELVRNR